MEFRIADTFTDSLAKLTGDEQKAVKTTAFDLQLNPANPGMQFHKLDRARDPNFWSVRVSRDIRVIVHKTKANLLLCYVDHHDAAYAWAERRKLETHPKTGAAQLVEIRETVREIEIPKYVDIEVPAPEKPALFESYSDDELLGYGVPPEWLADVKNANEDSLFDVASYLPSEAAEALLELATGGKPKVAEPVGADTSPFEHPDAQRRFRLMKDVEELRQALDYPWEKWSVFLHPAQRELVQKNFNGPARVSGSAGTGKTVVALHRVAHLANENPDARLLLTTFSRPLARALQTKSRHLLSSRPTAFERIDVLSIYDAAVRLFQARIGNANVAEDSVIREILSIVAKTVSDHRFSQTFLWTEWRDVVDAWQLDTWEAYRDVQRLGRKTRLPEQQRKILWEIFTKLRQELEAKDQLTPAMMFASVSEKLQTGDDSPYDFAVVDEAQDLGVPQLRFLAALCGGRVDGLFFAGDIGQRIFQPPFSWKSLGVDVRGRSKTLRVNYRTSHQIRTQSDRLLPPELSDIDGNVEERRGTVSAFDGPPPAIKVYENSDAEIKSAAEWLKQRVEEKIAPESIGVFVRSDAELDRARKAIELAGLEASELESALEAKPGKVALITMHLAKGLEYQAVLVMACDDEILPLQSRVENVTDDSDLEEVYNTERHLLYVACTRARDRLMVSGVEPASEFLDDLLERLD